MAESATAPVPPPAADTYRPLSLLAIVGLGLAILSICVYLFNSEWLISLAVAGFVVSAIALYQIKRSDYAQAGVAVARFGMALSLVIGLSWITMATTVNLVIQAEAGRFAHQWFECLRDGKEGLAFVASVRPGSRPAELTAEDLEPRHLRAKYPSPQGSAYDLFRTVPLVEMLLRGGKEITWHRLGVEGYDYNQGSYSIKQRYRIDTPEAEMEISLLTISEEVARPEGPRREWRVELSGSPMLVEGMKSKAYGLELSKARQEVLRALGHWVSLIGLARKEEATKTLSGGPAVTAEFERLYPAMLQGRATLMTPNITQSARQPIVLQAKQEGKGWTLTLRSTIEAGQREVDFQTTWANDHPTGDISKWRITDLKYLGDRKKMEMPGG
jgi:hypothetical protein